MRGSLIGWIVARSPSPPSPRPLHITIHHRLHALDELPELDLVLEELVKGVGLDVLFKGGRIDGGDAGVGLPRRNCCDGCGSGRGHRLGRHGRLDLVQDDQTAVPRQDGNGN